MSKSKRQEYLRSIKSFPESKPGILRRINRGAYDTDTGKGVILSQVGQVCQGVQIRDGIAEKDNSEVIKQNFAEILIAFDETLITYDANWTEVSRATAEPFKPDKNNHTLIFNGSEYTIESILNLDALNGGVYNVSCRK
ncbi:hypothetical protein KAR91_30720 [Candidatus Pacearchaeota archaeon]|nr:hypothetical protein [Candidatus Pacearchaeota archaeon]